MGKPQPALVIVLTAAAVVIVALVRQKQSLEARYRELAARLADPYVGMYVPSLQVASVEGDSVAVARPGPGEKEVLFVFNTTCPYCRVSVPFWSAVAERLAADPQLWVYGLSLAVVLAVLLTGCTAGEVELYEPGEGGELFSRPTVRVELDSAAAEIGAALGPADGPGGLARVALHEGDTPDPAEGAEHRRAGGGTSTRGRLQ